MLFGVIRMTMKVIVVVVVVVVIVSKLVFSLWYQLHPLYSDITDFSYETAILAYADMNYVKRNCCTQIAHCTREVFTLTLNLKKWSI